LGKLQTGGAAITRSSAETNLAEPQACETWFEPELSVEIEYGVKSAEQEVRHPVFKGSPCRPLTAAERRRRKVSGYTRNWPISDLPTAMENVRVRGQSGKHMLALSSSQFGGRAVLQSNFRLYDRAALYTGANLILGPPP
jgi:hypothetical protein